MPRQSPAQDLPADVLWEIFLHSLSELPLDDVQPSTKIAPMQLCHVCTSWRTVALDNPALWSHLHYCLPIRWEKERPIAWSAERFLRDMEFLKWWRHNQGSRAPFIRFSIATQKKGTTYEELPLNTAEIINFFVEYPSSAQYLDVDRLGRYLFAQNPTNDKDILLQASALPNLHSLVTSHFCEKRRSLIAMSFFEQIQLPSALRRLALHDVELPPDYKFTTWSRLTYLSLKHVATVPSVWYTLIRSIPALQWGFFDVFLEPESPEVDINPSEFILASLSTLSLNVHSSDENPEPDPLAELLDGLNLPALLDLSIYIDVDFSQSSLPELAEIISNNINRSASTIKKLTIGLKIHGFDQYSIAEPEEWECVSTLSMVAPRLTHLIIDMGNKLSSSRLECMASIWENFLFQGPWVDLESPMNTIQKITAVVQRPERRGPEIDAVFREELGEKLDNIQLLFVKVDPKDLSPVGEGWKLWGSSVY
ncbi:hypothetical protein BDN70DRAFT_935347 [Pholiota conissans]|uniref:F-box domain-containing protein n=1 Tax=Pholiota conissans TaxID=109636 RepID=A0A9P5YYA5_9AGAR|nr:hypothetical protein BDN70DRAFT_935347 [Pholiota conissans]